MHFFVRYVKNEFNFSFFVDDNISKEKKELFSKMYKFLLPISIKIKFYRFP